MPRPSLLFYCQHAMGMGHLVRSLALAEALAQSFRVVLINGGQLPPDVSLPGSIEIINLPPLRLVEGLLESCDDRFSTAEARETRRELILASFRSLRPEILLTELFPFGRRKFEFELLPLLAEAKARGNLGPQVACSLRDILVSKQQERAESLITTANRFFDAILVHSDPSFARFEDSFCSRTPLAPPVYHTGFVVKGRQKRAQLPAANAPVVVSAGGGRYGFQLLSAALKAHALVSQTEPLALRLIAGPFLPTEQWELIHRAASDRHDVSLVRSVPDLFDELFRARASISQCGYNTAMDLLQAGVPALVVPFFEGGEDEQLKRARRLESRGAVRVLEQKELTAARLAKEIRGFTTFRPAAVELDFNGAGRSAEILLDLWRSQSVCMSIPQTPSVGAFADTSWLDPVRRALDESDAEVDFFFRDDDAGWANDEFRTLLALFRRHCVPLDIAAIPTALTGELAGELSRLRTVTPAAIGIHQHGFAHTNYETTGRKSEFGVSRSSEDQFRDIQLGKLKLEQMLGPISSQIFTPPWNRCTEVTATCLLKLGFRVLSRDASAPSLAVPGLKELPIAVDWFAKKKGVRLSFENLGLAIASLVKKRQRPIGIMLHHELMTAGERQFLNDLLGLLAAHPRARCKLMREIAGAEATAAGTFAG